MFTMALQVRELLHTKEMASKLAGLDMKPDDLLKSLLGPWGPSNPQTDLERHKMEKSLTGVVIFVNLFLLLVCIPWCFISACLVIAA